MPAIQNEYDDYGYIAMRRGTASAAPRLANSKKTTSQRRKNVKPKATKVSTSKIAATKRANKESIRVVMRDNSKAELKTTSAKTNRKTTTNVSRAKTTTTKRKATHNLDVPNIKKKNVSAKPQEISLKKAEMMKSPKQKANEKTLKKENVLKNTAVFLCIFSALLLVCYRSSLINESFQALGTLKNELDDVYTLNAQIESDIQTQTDLSNIETYAKYQLGMQKPKESQIQKIYVEKEDRISTPIIVEEEEDSFWDNLINDFLNLID